MNNTNTQTYLSGTEKENLEQRAKKLKYSMIYEYRQKNAKNNLLMFIMD